MVSLVTTGWGQGGCTEKNRKSDQRGGSKQVADQGLLWQAGLLPNWHCLLHVVQASFGGEGGEGGYKTQN